jgi:hypothetical protein
LNAPLLPPPTAQYLRSGSFALFASSKKKLVLEHLFFVLAVRNQPHLLLLHGIYLWISAPISFFLYLPTPPVSL